MEPLSLPVRTKAGAFAEHARLADEDAPCYGGTWKEHMKGAHPESLFDLIGHTARDRRTGLSWHTDAGSTGFPLTWQEALDYVSRMNRDRILGYSDWHLPNRRELFSLVSHSRTNPCLPADHPFTGVFPGYYWTSTTCARLTGEAWYVHLGGARVHRGMKHASHMVWPVRGGGPERVLVPRTGQGLCYGPFGQITSCEGSGQDGALKVGIPWPEPRFLEKGETVRDNLTGLTWKRGATCTEQPVDWKAALETIERLNAGSTHGRRDWRLPTVCELESLTDMGAHSPALPGGHPFEEVKNWYWTCTTSAYEPRYAWALYMVDGAVGVGFKAQAEFFVWAVAGTSSFTAGRAFPVPSFASTPTS